MKKFDIWLADLDPSFGTEAGKKRPVVIVQTDLLNNFHASTLICLTTTKLRSGITHMRVRLTAGEAGLTYDSDIMVDQVRAIDNNRLVKFLGQIDVDNREKLDENLRIMFDL